MLLINFFKKASGCFFCLFRKILMLFLYSKARFTFKFFLFFFSFISTVSAQDLDSLYTIAKKTKNDSIKLKLYNQVGFNYIFNDSDKALKVLLEGEKLAIQKEMYYNLTQLTNTHGIYMDVLGKSDSARYYFNKALSLSKKYSYPDLEVRCVNNLGMYNWNRGNFKDAQGYFFKALKMNEEYGTEKLSAKYLNNIGLIYQEMNVQEKALEYHLKSYEIRKKYGLRKEETASLNNIGICLDELNRYEEALEKYTEGLHVGKTSGNLIDYYKILENIASLHNRNENYSEAIEFYKQALQKPSELTTDKKGDLIIYGKLSGIYNKLNNPKEALMYSKKAKVILDNSPFYNSYADDHYINTAESYYRVNNLKKARDYVQLFIKVKDSLFSNANANAIADLEVKYETEKKEKKILVQRAELAEQDVVIQKRNYQIYGLIGFAIVLALLSYLFYNQQKLKNKQLQKENELKDALLKIETQNRLQEQRLRISRDLHDNIGAQLTFIISSLDNLKYGFKVPEELEAKLNSISAFTSSTIYELRDTIWAMNKSEITFEDLEARISNFIDKAKISSEGIQFNFNVNKNVSEEIVFTSVQGMNVYRIIQEAINNAIKYAAPSHVKVDVLEKNNALAIEISDNGKGFNQKDVELGNGINNMKKRSLELEAGFLLESKKGSGTSIQLLIPINT